MARGTNKSKSARILKLFALLLASRRPLTFAEIQTEIAEYQGIAQPAALRKFERDKKELRALGVPLVAVAAVEGGDNPDAYAIDRRRCVLPPICFAPEELFLLEVLGASLREDEHFPLREDLLSALAKLSCRAGYDLLHVTPEDVPLRIRWASEGTTGEETERAKALLAAVRARKNATLRYRAVRGGEPVERVVSPYGMFTVGAVWYLVGYCHLRRDLRVFRVSRIEALSVNQHLPGTPDYDIPDSFRLADVAAGLPWAFGEGEGTHVSVQFDAGETWRFSPEWREHGAVTPCNKGGLVWTVDVRNLDRFFLWLLTQGPGVRVVSPPHIVARARALLMAMRDRYAGAPTRA